MSKPIPYKCTGCGGDNRKLWRQWNTFANRIRLLCAPCACANQAVSIRVDPDGYHEGDYGRECFIGSLCPALPADEGTTFWGYTSAPEDVIKWWKDLPL